MQSRFGVFCFLAILPLLVASAAAQVPGGPPAVGVVHAARQQITQSDEFIGRIQAVNRVALVARITAFLEKRAFVEGAEVKKDDLLYLLEQPPFQAQVDAAKASVEQLEAQHRNAELTLQRAQALMAGPAGQQSNVDTALASERSLAAQIAGAQAQLRTAQINLSYTEITAPIDGKISSTAVTAGNVVSPTSGTLANLVSQDPMYVLFPISLRAGLDLRNRYAAKGGFSAVIIKLRLPDGRLFAQEGKLDYISPTVAENTDTLTVRGVVPNPLFPGMKANEPGSRELTDGEFVTVLLEGVQPITVLGIPRAAVLSDQQGDYVYVLDAQNKAQIRRVQLGQSTPSTAVVTNGLTAGEVVISEGLQRVRPGEAVAAGPASPPPAIAPGAQGNPSVKPAAGAPGAPGAKP
ncbi:MAG TPA: efflux RND transporter periplasmic adaptor subunit [Stellaceae bacterium]|jgi:membrane fusion protein (multidrug efflux system)|nr:efflux RND transporter periplasmic adaptor subunit [Stellaceae bacterium]